MTPSRRPTSDLFTTLVRFDVVYHGHFKCNWKKLTELPALWAYARDLFQTPGLGDTVDFDHIKRHYFCVHEDINPTGIVPTGPDLMAWLAPHGRASLGGAPLRRRHAAGAAHRERAGRPLAHAAAAASITSGDDDDEQSDPGGDSDVEPDPARQP